MMKRMLIIGISQFMIGFISYRCHKIALSKDSMLARRKEVYITYFYYVICNYTMILALGIMFFLHRYPFESRDLLYKKIYILIDGLILLVLIFCLNWQINWKIIYDEKGFTYRSKWRKCYTFSYNDPFEIRRTRGFVYLYARGIKIRIDKRDARNWEPFMEILTDHQSKLQDQTVKKSKPEFSNKRYSRKMRKKKKGD